METILHPHHFYGLFKCPRLIRNSEWTPLPGWVWLYDLLYDFLNKL